MRGCPCELLAEEAEAAPSGGDRRFGQLAVLISLLGLDHSEPLAGSPVGPFFGSEASWSLGALLDSEPGTLVDPLLRLPLGAFWGFEPKADLRPPRSGAGLGALGFSCFGLPHAPHSLPRLVSLATGLRQRILYCLFQVDYWIVGEFPLMVHLLKS